VGFFFLKEVGTRDLNGISNKSFKDDRFLGRVVMRLGIEVSVDVCLFSIKLVDTVIIRFTGDENI